MGSKAELAKLEHVTLMDGNAHFKVKGFAKSPEEKRVVLLVEGGTLIYDEEGTLAEATGDALALVNAALGEDDDAQRKLGYGYSRGYGGGSSGGYGYGRGY